MKPFNAFFLIIGANFFTFAFAFPARADIVNGDFSALPPSTPTILRQRRLQTARATFDFRLAATIYTAVEINWNSQSGKNYQVQYATALNTNSWLNLGVTVAGTGTNNSAFDSIRSQPMKFASRKT